MARTHEVQASSIALIVEPLSLKNTAIRVVDPPPSVALVFRPLALVSVLVGEEVHTVSLTYEIGKLMSND